MKRLGLILSTFIAVFGFGVSIWTNDFWSSFTLTPVETALALVSILLLCKVMIKALDQSLFREMIVFFGILILIVAINAWQSKMAVDYGIAIGIGASIALFAMSVYIQVPLSPKLSSPETSTVKYRPEIDGLRALAVGSVLLYHLKFRIFGGGFVGVDVFFVISGYLISSIILRDVEQSHFSLAEFYERRIRRIFPSLFVVLLTAIVIGFFLFDSESFKGFGGSVVSTTFFASNYLFFQQSGYFDAPAELKPLLHTWSLAVEEQFYMFFPLFFVAGIKIFKQHNKIFIGSFALASLVFSLVWYNIGPTATFYLLPFRAWEMLAGTLLAIGFLPKVKNKLIAELIGIFGLGLIVASILLFTPNTPFPYFSALIPIIGTTAFIHAADGQETLVKKVFSLKPAVFIGKISYPLYLWHWVFIVYATYYNIEELDLKRRLLVILASVILATITWNFIEAPIRDRRKLNRKWIFVLGGSVMAAVALMGFVIVQNDGFGFRWKKLPVYSLSATGDNAYLTDCFDELKEIKMKDLAPEEQYFVIKESACVLGDRKAQPEFAVIGDSHAKALAYGINEYLSAADSTGLVFYKSGCPSIIGVAREGKPDCHEYFSGALRYLIENDQITTVFLASRWAKNANGTEYPDNGKLTILSKIGEDIPTKPTANSQLLELGLENLIQQLEADGIKVVFIHDVPESGYSVPIVYERNQNSRFGKDFNSTYAPTISEFNERYAPIIGIADNLKKKFPNMEIINLYEQFCGDDYCMVEENGFPLYRDSSHLNAYGSIKAMEYLKPTFIQMGIGD